MRNIFTTYIATAKQYTGTFFKSFLLLCAFSLGFSYLTLGQVTQTFTSNGTFIVPAGVTQISVTCFGGGGAGGGASATSRNGGGGGGGASVTVTNYPVTPGSSLTIVVGQGGTGVSANTGNPGGASSVSDGGTMFIRASGGAGGQRGANSSSAGAGGTGGAIANNIPANTGFRGGNGGNSNPVTSSRDEGGGGGGGAGTTAIGNNGTIVTAGTGGATGGGVGGAGASTTSSAGANGTAGNTLGGGGGGSSVWTGSNRAGAAGARGEVRITYVDCTAPTALTYNDNTAAYCRSLAITANNPSFLGSPATSYSVNPALPTGLSLNTSNGTITGTPTTAQAAANYTVTVNNNCGSTTRVLSITVNTPPTASAGTNISVARGTAAALSGSYSGATGVSWTSNVLGTFSPSNTVVNPTWLPNDPTWTGVATLTMTTTGAAPCNNTSSNVTVTVTIPAICPGQNTGSATFNAGSGGGISSYEVSINDGASYVAYTPGAAINTASAIGSVKIRATQTVNGCTDAAVYTLWTIRTDCCNAPTVTATTAASSIGCTIATTGGNITVAVTDPCSFIERGVAYSTTASPTIANSKVVVAGSSGSYSANLTGLTNGTLYYVRAYAISSSGTVYGPQITFTTLAAPSNLNYTLNTVTYCTGSAITTNNPTFTGAAATSYSVIPALPTGLTLNTSTGTITGTPTVAVAATNYTVTVTNACGNTTRAVNITVIAPPTSPSFTTGATKLCNGTTSTYTASASGGGLSVAYSILSGGATIDASTGFVSSVTSNFTVRATITNACNSTTVDRVVEVLTPNAVRNAPTGPQCSGTQLNFSAAPAGGNGTFTYAWNVRTNGSGAYGSGVGFLANTFSSPTTGSAATFAPIPLNSNSNGNTFYVEVAITSNGNTCTQVFSPTINPEPETPSIGTITHPFCGSSTGSIALTNLPATGTWAVTGSPSGFATGTGTTAIISSLTSGNYTFVVQNSFGCTSGSSAQATIGATPAIPSIPTPTVAYTCSNGSASLSGGTLGANEVFRWYNIPSAGTVVSTANPFVPSLTQTTNYYVSRFNNVSLCESARVPVVVTKQGLDVYTPTRNIGTTFTNIVGGVGTTAVSSWRNGTSNGNLSENINIGFSFPFDGSNHTQFRISTNGFITFNTSSNASGDALVACGNGDAFSADNFNTFTRAGAKGSLQTIAPFYDQLIPNGFTLNTSVHHQVIGASPNRVLTVQWRGLSRTVSSNCSPCNYGSYTFQIKLYEANGDIEFVYGSMTTGSSENSKRYSCGLNSASLAAPLNASKLFTQQTANTANFSSIPVNNLSAVPATNTSILFTRYVPEASAVVPQCIAYNYPANGSTAQCRNTLLSWNALDGAPTGYDVYLSTNQSLVNNADASVRVATNQNTPFYGSPSMLDASATYYWKIVPRNNAGLAVAANMPVWSFSTSPGDVVSSISSSAGTTFCRGTTTTLTVNGTISEGSEYNWTSPFIFNFGCKVNPPFPLLSHIFDDNACAAASRILTFNNPGTFRYDVFTKGCNGTSGCATIIITVLDFDNTAPTSITSSNGTTICAGNSTILTANGGTHGAGAEYEWFTGGTCGGTPFAVTIGNTVTVTPSAGTTYRVRRTGGNTCPNTIGCASLLINIQNAIANNTISAAQTICNGATPAALSGSIPLGGNGTYTYDWQSSTTSALAGFSTATGTSNGINYTPGLLTQTTWYRRTVTSGTCTTENMSNVVEVTVNANPTAGITNNSGTTIITCTTPSISTTATGGTSYAWSGGAGAGGNRSFTSAGTYTVTVTDANTCTATAQIILTQNTTPPTVSITNNTGVTELNCTTTSINLTATGGTSYSWNNSLGAGAIQSISIPGNYVVTATAANGCTSTASLNITQNLTTPLLYSVGGGGNMGCGAAGLTISLSGSEPGTEYQLVLNGLEIGTPISGTGSALEWNNQSVIGTYTVTANNAGSCAATMTGNATITSSGLNITSINSSLGANPIIDDDIIWTGLNDINWSNTGNWLRYNASQTQFESLSVLPTTNQSVFILSQAIAGLCVSASNHPTVSQGFTGNAKNIFIGNSSILSIAGTIELTGNWINNGTFIYTGTAERTVVFNGNSNQNITSNWIYGSTNNTFFNLIIANSGTLSTVSVKLADNLKVFNTIVVEEGKLDVDNKTGYTVKCEVKNNAVLNIGLNGEMRVNE